MGKPSVGVGAVVFRGADILLIKRGKPPFLAMWSIPGGGLNYGERLEDAVLREIHEETGVRIKIIGLIGVFEALPSMTPDRDFLEHLIFIDYAAEWTSGEPRAGDDAKEAEFVCLDEALRRVSWDETRRAITDAVKLREKALKRL